MSGILKPYKSLINLIDFYRELGIKYRVERSGNSIALFVKGSKYFASTVNMGNAGATLPSKQLFFIQKVRSHIMKENLIAKIKKNYAKQNLIQYIGFNDDIGEGEVFEKAYSVDIKNAYWESAYKEGWLNDDIYIEGKGMDKRIRLASLGTFAKKKFCYSFDGKGDEYLETIEMPKHPHVFFNQANTIYWLMDDCRKLVGDEFIFYWTDGVYVKSLEAAKKIESYLTSKGYEHKTEKLVNIIRHFNGFQTTEIKKLQNGKSERKTKVYKSNLVK